MRQVVPDKERMREYLDRGLTHIQIRDAWEKDSGLRAGRTAISHAISRYGLGGRRPRYSELIPWSPIAVEHNHNYILRMLRREARRMNGEDLDRDELSELESWKKELAEKNCVVAYRYDSPDGFYAVPREEGDLDLIEGPPYEQTKV